MGDSTEKKRRKKWDPESMMNACNAIINKEMGYLKASKAFRVPRSTLESYVKNRSKTVDELIITKLGRRATFTPEMEKELVDYCLLMANNFYGLRASDIQKLAFQLATKNQIPHQFLSNKESAGRKWLKLFLKRNPSLSFRKPQATSANRVKGFTREKIKVFYDILDEQLIKIDFDPCRIYNVDETGVTIVQHKQAKVLSLKGQKQVGGLSSADRGGLITLVTCMSAGGVYVPPLIIFPRVNMKNELKDGAPPGSVFACHKSGWIQDYIFTQWFSHFIATTKPTKKKPVILIFDGHFSHTRNMDIIDMARENGVILISLPPHTSGKLQPLDVAFMSPFKTYYAQEIENWLKAHHGRLITSYQISELVGKAYLRAASLETAVNGFRKTGIWPFDRCVFKEHEFVQFEMTELDVLPEETREELSTDASDVSVPTMRHNEPCALETASVVMNPGEIRESSEGRSRQETKENLSPSILEPSTSSFGVVSVDINLSPVPKKTVPTIITGKAAPVSQSPSTVKPSTSSFRVGPADISPIPQFQKSVQTTRTGKAALISGSPYKLNLESQLTKKKQAPTAKTKKTSIRSKKDNNKTTKKNKKVKRKILQPSSSSNSNDGEGFQLDSEDSGADENDTDCLYCNNSFSNDNSGESWIRCISCYRWAHELCAGVDPHTIDFICELCINVS